MASSAPTSALRQLIENRLSQLSTEVEALFDEGRDRARRELTDQLHQAVRRMRQAADSEELAATLTETASGFAPAVALFRVDGDNVRGERIRGLEGDAAERFIGMQVPLAAAAALAGAVETRDPVTAVPTEKEVSPEIAGVFGHAGEGRVTIIPVLVREQARALLYAPGAIQLTALETLCQVAAAVWGSMEPIVVNVPAPAPAPELVQIAAAAPAPKARPTWESLPVEEQQVHLKAQRFARVQVAQIRLQDAQAVQSGRAKRDLYGALQQRIDDTRTVFRERFFTGCPSMVDYLHLELVRNLAQEDADLLGKDYPGPLV
jgi:hypothetical protein